MSEGIAAELQPVPDGAYIVKRGVVYSVDPRMVEPYSKSVNLMTGETHYPTNRDWLRHLSDEELARWIADELIEPGYYEGDTCYKLWLDWLRQEAGE